MALPIADCSASDPAVLQAFDTLPTLPSSRNLSHPGPCARRCSRPAPGPPRFAPLCQSRRKYLLPPGRLPAPGPAGSVHSPTVAMAWGRRISARSTCRNFAMTWRL